MTATILNSSLNDHFELIHFDTTLNRDLERIGSFSIRKGIQLWKQYHRFSKELRREPPDLVLVPLSQTPAGLIKDLRFVRIAHKAGIRTVAHLHGGELDRTLERSSNALRSHAEKALRKLDGAIVLGEALRKIFKPYLPDDRVFTVPNGLNIPAPLEDRHAPPPFRLLFLSNPIRRKGIEDAIEAVKLLQDRGHKLRMDVAGEWFEPDLEKNCKERVKKEELAVIFHPPLGPSKKEELLNKAQLFILPPREPEGLPVALIEALAHGIPIISTDQGAISDTVTEGWNGTLVLPKDPSSIAEKAAELIGDPTERERFSKRSRERYEARFTEKSLSENSYHCFKTLLEQPFRG